MKKSISFIALSMFLSVTMNAQGGIIERLLDEGISNAEKGQLSKAAARVYVEHSQAPAQADRRGALESMGQSYSELAEYYEYTQVSLRPRVWGTTADEIAYQSRTPDYYESLKSLRSMIESYRKRPVNNLPSIDAYADEERSRGPIEEALRALTQAPQVIVQPQPLPVVAVPVQEPQVQPAGTASISAVASVALAKPTIPARLGEEIEGLSTTLAALTAQRVGRMGDGHSAENEGIMAIGKQAGSLFPRIHSIIPKLFECVGISPEEVRRVTHQEVFTWFDGLFKGKDIEGWKDIIDSGPKDNHSLSLRYAGSGKYHAFRDMYQILLADKMETPWREKNILEQGSKTAAALIQVGAEDVINHDSTGLEFSSLALAKAINALYPDSEDKKSFLTTIGYITADQAGHCTYGARGRVVTLYQTIIEFMQKHVPKPAEQRHAIVGA